MLFSTLRLTPIKASLLFRVWCRGCRSLGSMSLSEDPLFRGLLTPEVSILSRIFKDHGFQLRLAGGAVRDILARKEPKVRKEPLMEFGSRQ